MGALLPDETRREEVPEIVEGILVNVGGRAQGGF
jgi:hypothetical protein